MASQAGCAFVDIAVYALVFFIGFRIAVANSTAKYRKIRRVGVAIHALIPFSFVFTAVNGEIQVVVLGKRRRHPAGIGGMARSTVGWKLGADVIGIERPVVICLVAGCTVGRRIGIRA